MFLFSDKILKSLMKGITDRNPTIRRSYASTIAVITTVAKESTVNKLIQSLKDLYLENEGMLFSFFIFVFLFVQKIVLYLILFLDDSVRQTVGHALKGISQCEKPDLYLANIIPLIFFATHSKQTESNIF